jgi:hypothetical protein
MTLKTSIPEPIQLKDVLLTTHFKHLKHIKPYHPSSSNKTTRRRNQVLKKLETSKSLLTSSLHKLQPLQGFDGF